MIKFCAVGPRAAGAGGPSGTGEILTEEPDSAFGNGRVRRFGLYSPHGRDHHPWSLLSGDVRIRKVSLAVAKPPLSFFEGWYGVRGPLLGRQGEWRAIWSLKAGRMLKWAEKIGRLQP